jgi:hypothetical protein
MKAIFIGGQEGGSSRQVLQESRYLHFIEHPYNNEVYANTEKNSYKYNELTYCLLYKTPNNVLVYELMRKK